MVGQSLQSFLPPASPSRGLIATTRHQRGADLGPVTVRFGHRARCGLMRQKKNSWSSFSSFFSQLQMSLALLRLEGIVHFQVALEETGPLPIVLFEGGCIQVFFSKIHVQQPNWVESLQKAILGTDKSFWTAKSGSWQTCMYLIVALVTLFNFAYLV